MSRKRRSRPRPVVAPVDHTAAAIAYIERVIENLEHEIRIRRSAIDAIKIARLEGQPTKEKSQ